MSLARFASEYDPDGRRCKMVSFEYEGNASLTWYLSNKEKFSLVYPFLPNNLISKLGGENEDSLALNPLKVSLGGFLYKKIVKKEGKRFIARVQTAIDRQSTATEREQALDKRYLKQKRSRQLIRGQLQGIQKWWHEF